MDAPLARENFCYLTTTGRRTGEPRRIEIWFAAADDGEVIYLLAGGRERAGWVRNLRAEPRVTVEIAGRRFAGTAHVVDDRAEDRTARRLVYEKYRDYDALEEWRDAALPVAIALRDVD
jgi:deazaflavin-dependent oxidoreductase (nitroreductase family)